MKSNRISLADIKLEIIDQNVIRIKGRRYRMYRRAISELRKQEVIFIPIGNYIYLRIEECTKEEIDNYVRKQLRSMKTQYFNTLNPIRKYMTAEQLELLHNGGLFKQENMEVNV